MLSWFAPYKMLALAMLAAAALGVIGAQYLTIQHLRAGIAEQLGAMAQERANAALAALRQQQEHREEEQRRIAAQKEALDAAEQNAARARADLAVADAAAGRLRDRLAAFVAAAREAAGNPHTVQPGQAASDPAGVLADVLGRCITRVRFLAAVADERGTAGQLCERYYDALNPGK